MALQLPSFLGASSVECVVVAIGSWVKNLLIQWETEEENQLNQSIKNLRTQWELGKKTERSSDEFADGKVVDEKRRSPVGC